MAAQRGPLLKANPERSAIKAHTLSQAVVQVPVMCNLGTKEGVTVKEGRFAGVWPSNETFFSELRARGGLVGVAVDPLTSHECGNQRYLAIRWLDACMAARLPEQSGGDMKSMSKQGAWLAPLLGTEAVPAAKFAGEAATSVWLPDEATAKAWMQYVKDTAIMDATPPPAPTNVRVEAGELKWDAVADLESGIGHFIIERDGQEISTVPAQPKNPFGRPVFQGLQYSDTPAMPLVKMSFAVAEGAKGDGYRVIAVNTAGLRSGK
ncbi:hypothetical protein [Verrucomicrobium spinosum]|uniref:hypothetical protein n=1 Tax=Verrucomicrobium spinosum TaxID=2736 RepID=UPI000A5D1EA9|nr:hypothetical protein [Verrucomicrobium spinosum]